MSKRLLITLLILLLIANVGLIIFYLYENRPSSNNKFNSLAKPKKYFTSSGSRYPQEIGVVFIKGDEKNQVLAGASLFGYIAGSLYLDNKTQNYLLPVFFPTKYGESIPTYVNFGDNNSIIVVAPAKNGNLDGDYQTEPLSSAAISNLLKENDPILISIYYQQVGNNFYRNCSTEQCKKIFDNTNRLYQNNKILINALTKKNALKNNIEIGPAFGITVFIQNR